jgi:hypothetical protein
MRDARVTDIVLAGAAGGLVYWAFTILRGGQPAADVAQFAPATWFWVSLLLTCIVGAGAAFLMVYFVAATNVKERMKAIGFAVACGLCWEPALSGEIDQFTRTYGDQAAQATVAEAQQLSGPSASSTTPDQTAAVAVDLVTGAPNVQNPILKQQVADATSALVNKIDSAPSSDAKTMAWKKVASAAAGARNSQLLARSVKSLEDIADSNQPEASQARAALNSLHAQLGIK